MDDFISKPFTKKTLMAKAAKWVNPRLGQTSRRISSVLFQTAFEPEERAAKVRSEKPFDLEKAIAEFEGDQAFLAEIIEGFFAKVTEQIGILRQALSAGDAETIRKEAHSIKGGAANLTADVLSEVAFELEKKGKSGELQGAAEIIDELQKEFESLKSYWGEHQK